MKSKNMTLSLVIPAYFEEKTLEQLLQKVIDADMGDITKELVIINDGSTDKTLEIAKKFAEKNSNKSTKFNVLDNEKNLGKSQSVRKGILASTGDLVVIQDADLEYEPKELRLFVELFKEDPDMDFIYGNRFGKKNKVVYWQNWFGNRFLTLVSNFFTFWNNMWVSDMEVCYKMVKGDIFREIAEGITSTSSFGFEPEVTAKLAKRRLKYTQVPISYHPRTIAEGKHMNAWKDGMKALIEIIKFNLG